MNDISGAFLENPDSTVHHAECSFIVQVRPFGGVVADAASNCDQNRKLSSVDTEPSGKAAEGVVPEPIPYDKEMQNTRPLPQPYHLQASSVAERDHWMVAINTALRAYQRDKAEKARQRASALRMYQLRLRSFYTGLPFQTSTALLVAVNFFVTVSAAF